MQCLVVGDLHLDPRQACPSIPAEWRDYDVVAAVGDILDHGVRSLEVGRELFERLDELDFETVVVPGNHDHQHYPALIEGLSSVKSIHESTTTIDGWVFYGLGSDRFDDGSELRYPEIPELSDADSDPEAFERQLAKIATSQIEPADFVNDEQAVDRVRRSLDLYATRLNTLDELALDHTNEESVLVTHLPPFGTGLDRLSPQNPRYPKQALGSMAIRTHLRRYSPTFNVCGHIHEGEGIGNVEGCLCLNAGRRATYSIKLTESSRDAIDRERELDLQ